MTAEQALVLIRKEIEERKRYHQNGRGIGFESEQSVAEVLAELLCVIDRIGGRTYAMHPFEAPRQFKYQANNFINSWRARTLFEKGRETG